MPAGTFDHILSFLSTHHGCFSTRANRVYIVHYCGNPLQSGKLTTMGHGDHFTTQQVYGVGIAAHGDDEYSLGHVSLWQAMGGNKWVPKFAADKLDLCISTNDSGCYPNIEIKIEGSEKTTENNGGVFWRTDNERVPYSNLCVQQKELTATTNYCENIKQCDWKHNHSCGSSRTITLNPCGSRNEDKVKLDLVYIPLSLTRKLTLNTLRRCGT